MILHRDMHASRVFNILSRQIEGEVQRAGTGRPLDFLPEENLAILFRGAEGDDEVEVGGAKGLAQVGGDGDDGFEEDGALVDVDFGGFEEANWSVKSASGVHLLYCTNS